MLMVGKQDDKEYDPMNKSVKKYKIYFMFSYTGTLYSKLLRRILRVKYTHVSICLDQKAATMYSFGRKNPPFMFPSGFVKESLTMVNQTYKKTICEIYELEITDSKYFLLKENLEKFISHQDEYAYNILGLIPLGFNIAIRRNRHFVCSQFVGKLIQETGIYDLKKDYSLIKPYDIKKISHLNKIYEGSLSDYLSLPLKLKQS